ncbi:DUF968 domain-containing protein [Vibrio sp. TBV020]|uniref:DUF968 domain-containing protein n=1 Tax=Vibrio sp. TBV020 TaxID=3137398 RepID=UPI0038CD4223
MIKVNIDIVPTLKAAIVPLEGITDKLKELIVNGQVGLVSPGANQSTEEREVLQYDDATLVSFFADRDVQQLIGPTSRYADSLDKCQLADNGYCDHNLKTRNTGEGAIRLCWHHDNLADNDHKAFNIARLNSVRHGLQRVSQQLHGKQVPITDADICWWAVRNGVSELLPQSILDRQFPRMATSKRLGVTGSKDTNERYNPESQREQLERLAKPMVLFSIDNEPPAMYMRKPKPLRWHNVQYIDFVLKLKCCACGEPAEVAQHLIGHGEMKMGETGNDFFTFPLCHVHAKELGNNPLAWEQKHGNQLFHMKTTQKKAFEVGAVMTGDTQ